ncbi:MAG: hypothetical protein ABEN55_08115, partial [Bradymonadaceae bacterium]
MSEGLSQWQRRTAAGALFVVAAGIFLYLALISSSADAPSETAPNDGAAGQLDPTWAGDDGSAVTLKFDETRGPIWVIAEDRSISLTPLPDEADISWTLRRSGGDIAMIGTGRWSGADLQARWHFQRGNPQASFSVRLSDVPIPTLRNTDFSASIALPPGRLHTADGHLAMDGPKKKVWPYHISPWKPAWLQWRGERDRLTLLDWTGDGLTLEPDGDGTTLRVHLWHPDAHPLLQTCAIEQKDAPPSVDLHASGVFYLGAAPSVFPSRLPSAREAALAPIFALPSAHPDSTLHQGSPDNPEEWAARARTIAFGHSNVEDPRYGNGGLLGHGLGGTIAVPADWWNKSPVADFRDEVRGTEVAIAPRGDIPDSPNGARSAIGESLTCRALTTA